MKTYIYSLLVCFALVSCNDMAEINIDPDNPSEARPEEVLTSAINYTAFVLDAQYNRTATIWGQYVSWGVGVSLGEWPRYRQNAAWGNQAWARSYSDALTDLTYLKRNENRAFSGMAKVLEAYVYHYLVDHFGDIPFSEAVQGAIADGSKLTPAFDDDADIYPALVDLVDQALLDFEVSEDIGPEDILFDGKIDDWIDFANSFKLRLLMRMSDVVDVRAQVQETIEFGKFLENSQASVSFSGEPGSENPMFAWIESGIGNFYVAANTVINVMDEYEDPRLFEVYKSSENYPDDIIGSDQNYVVTAGGDLAGYFSSISERIYRADEPTIFMSSWETWFLRAEANFKFQLGVESEFAFEQAIRSNFSYLETDGADEVILALDFNNQNHDDQYKLLAIQKWISMTGLQEAEGWIEARRFDIPGARIFTGAEGVFQTPLFSFLPDRVFPNRWKYPQSEINANPNFPGQIELTERVFWDL